MRLHNLVKSGGFRNRKRVGRGEGGGRGKTSGRGHKGQRARSGFGLRPGFESGHVPLYRKLPKRGFSNFEFRNEFAIVNLSNLDKRISGDIVDRASLLAAGLIRSSDRKVKLLGNGQVSRAFNVSVDACSASAADKISNAGGQVTVVSDTATAG